MNRRRHLVAWVVVFVGSVPGARLACAQSADEAEVRAATTAYVAAWNSHAPKAWAEFLTADVWYTEGRDPYERYKGRDKVLGWFAYSVENADLSWTVQKARTLPGGAVGVLLDQRMAFLPVVDGKYKTVFDSSPSYARWRREPDGRWRIAYFTSHAGSALAEMKKDGWE